MKESLIRMKIIVTIIMIILIVTIIMIILIGTIIMTRIVKSTNNNDSDKNT